jgi:8-oxo-dGTP diphosphatase
VEGRVSPLTAAAPLVVTAALIARNGKFLIAKRKAGGECGLLWELPGGKREPGETDEECLTRELREELSVESRVGLWYHTVVYRYSPDKIVELRVFRADIKGSFGRLAEHEEIRWISPAESDGYRFAPADLPVVERIRRERWVSNTI